MSNLMYANQVPTEKWRSVMTLPGTLALREANGKLYVAATPVKELDKLYLEKTNPGKTTINKELIISDKQIINNCQFELSLKHLLMKILRWN